MASWVGSAAGTTARVPAMIVFLITPNFSVTAFQGLPLRIGATPKIPMNGVTGMRACLPVSAPVKVANPVF